MERTGHIIWALGIGALVGASAFHLGVQAGE